MTRILAFAFAAALFAVPAVAQQQLQPGEVPARMGLGVGFSTATATPSFRIPLLVPLAGRPGFVRVEPYLSLLSSDRDTSLVQTVSDSTLEIGANVTYAIPVFPFAYAYGGGRLGLARRSYTRETTGPVTTTLEDSGMGVVVAAIVGGDVFLHPRLSLGVEAGLGYATSPKLEDGSPSTLLAGESSTLFSTGEIVMRFWFK